MSGSEPVRRVAQLLLWTAAGVGLLFLVRLGRTVLPGSLVPAAGLEEAAKLALFLGAAAWWRWGRPRFPKAWPRSASAPEGEGRWLMPFFAVAAFGVAESLLYYLRYPTSSIYGRLVISYPLHLNTALLFALAFASTRGRAGLRRPAVLVAAFLAAVGYHSGLNALSLLLPRFAPYLLGPPNLALFAWLQWRQRNIIVQRSLRYAGG